MAVRVRVRLACEGTAQARPVETVAVANSGFETPRPEVLLPVPVAERLGLWPPPPRARTARFESPAASFTMVTVPRSVRVSLAEARTTVRCDAAISERETEVVLSDRLVDALSIQLLAPGSGIYRIGERGRPRHSEKPERW